MIALFAHHVDEPQQVGLRVACECAHVGAGLKSSGVFVPGHRVGPSLCAGPENGLVLGAVRDHEVLTRCARPVVIAGNASLPLADPPRREDRHKRDGEQERSVHRWPRGRRMPPATPPRVMPTNGWGARSGRIGLKSIMNAPPMM